MLMDVGLDTGDMLLTEEVELSDTITAGELHDILMNSGGELLVKTLNDIVNHRIKPVRQDNEFTSYASMLDKEMAKINWEKKVV